MVRVPVSGHAEVADNRFVSETNIGYELVPGEFGNWRAYIIGATQETVHSVVVAGAQLPRS